MLRDRVRGVVRLGLDGPQSPVVVFCNRSIPGITTPATLPLIPEPNLAKSALVSRVIRQEPLAHMLELLAPSKCIVRVEFPHQTVECPHRPRLEVGTDTRTVSSPHPTAVSVSRSCSSSRKTAPKSRRATPGSLLAASVVSAALRRMVNVDSGTERIDPRGTCNRSNLHHGTRLLGAAACSSSSHSNPQAAPASSPSEKAFGHRNDDTTSCAGLSICTPPPPDAEGNPACITATVGRPTHQDRESMLLLSRIVHRSRCRAGDRRRSPQGRHHSLPDRSHRCGRVESADSIPRIDKTTVQEVLLTNSAGGVLSSALTAVNAGRTYEPAAP